MPLTLTVTSVDHAPAELHDQTPFDVELIREFPGPDRPDYWLASAQNPLWWLVDNHKTPITHVVIAARWTDTKIEPGIEDMPIGISFVADPSVLRDAELDFSKVRYAAIGMVTDTSGGGRPEPVGRIKTGRIARAFGMGTDST